MLLEVGTLVQVQVKRPDGWFFGFKLPVNTKTTISLDSKTAPPLDTEKATSSFDSATDQGSG